MAGKGQITSKRASLQKIIRLQDIKWRGRNILWKRRPLYRILCYYLLKMLYEKNYRNNKTDKKEKKKKKEIKNGKKMEKNEEKKHETTL